MLGFYGSTPCSKLTGKLERWLGPKCTPITDIHSEGTPQQIHRAWTWYFNHSPTLQTVGWIPSISSFLESFCSLIRNFWLKCYLDKKKVKYPYTLNPHVYCQLAQKITSSTPYKEGGKMQAAESRKPVIAMPLPFLYIHFYKYYQSGIRLDRNTMPIHSCLHYPRSSVAWQTDTSQHPSFSSKSHDKQSLCTTQKVFKLNWNMHHYVHIESSHFCTGNINSSIEETFWERRDLH